MRVSTVCCTICLKKQRQHSFTPCQYDIKVDMDSSGKLDTFN